MTFHNYRLQTFFQPQWIILLIIRADLGSQSQGFQHFAFYIKTFLIYRGFISIWFYFSSQTNKNNYVKTSQIFYDPSILIRVTVFLSMQPPPPNPPTHTVWWNMSFCVVSVTLCESEVTRQKKSASKSPDLHS